MASERERGRETGRERGVHQENKDNRHKQRQPSRGCVCLPVSPQDTSEDTLQESSKICDALDLRGPSLAQWRTPKSRFIEYRGTEKWAEV